MSGFISEPERSHEHHVATVDARHGQPERLPGEENDRIGRDTSTGQAVTSYERDEEATEIDISAGQKMLSAVSGSLLTSILGKALPYPKDLSLPIADTDHLSHTSRCCARPFAISTFNAEALHAPVSQSDFEIH